MFRRFRQFLLSNSTDRFCQSPRTTTQRLKVEGLEDRSLMATLTGLTDAVGLVRFDSASPATTTTPVAITNLGSGQTVTGIDYRPSTGQLYGLGLTGVNNLQLLVINEITGVATPVGTGYTIVQLDFEPKFGFSFDPVEDKAHVFANGLGLGTPFDILFDPDTGDFFDSANVHTSHTVSAIAHTNQVAGAVSTTVYGYDYFDDALITHDPSTGDIADVGPSGITANDSTLLGLDIAPDGTAYLNSLAGLDSNLYSMSLATGSATVLGTFAQTMRDVAVAANSPPVLNGANDFTSISPAAVNNQGDLVSDMVAGRISDSDPGALTGIAIVGSSGLDGAWQFSVDGGANWTPLGAVADKSATLLGTSPFDRIRFVPNTTNPTAASITFRAWDQSDGHVSGDTGVDAGIGGSDSAYSTADATSNIAVLDVGIVGNDLIINGTDGNDVIIVKPNADPSKLTVTINNNPPLTFDLAAIPGRIIVHGYGGNDRITVTGAVTKDASLFGDSGKDTLTGGGGSDLLDGGNDNDLLAGGRGDDTYRFADGWATDRITEAANAGTDTVDCSAITSEIVFTRTSTLTARNGVNSLTGAQLESIIGGAASDTLVSPAMPVVRRVLSRRGGAVSRPIVLSRGANLWEITGTNEGTLNGVLDFQSVENLTGGTGTDAFNLSDRAVITGTLDGKTGANTLSYEAYTTHVAILLQPKVATSVGGFNGITSFVGSAAGDDFLLGADTDTIWSLTGTNKGRAGQANFEGIEFLFGGTGDDTFKVSPAGKITGSLDAGPGTNTLDYSAFKTPVIFMYDLWLATGVERNVANVSNVIGGAGNDILVGCFDVNVLTGNGGRDILIGGGLEDTLIGGAGEDILIADESLYESDEFGVKLLMAEWSRTDQTYAQRVAHLRMGGGLNGGAVLDSSTVADDTVVDRLTGGAGTDWFFANLSIPPLDILTDRISPTEELN